MGKVELLAPAGNLTSFIAAINNGADAIYLGLNSFNARGNIENFTRENLEESVRTAHLFDVKVYITLNTLIFNNEIEEVLDLVRFCLKCKVDAFIVQDIGLARLLFQKFDGIELHASTQMGVQNLEGVKFLEQIGFKRIVLARETPLDEVKRISQNSNVELEYFVQGALCVGFSGNCYLCSLLAGASGNRGKCKQFCRLKYRLGENEGYFLSTKDFCMLPCLKELVESGIKSLKIEGRARRAGYVGVATATYRKALDNDFKFNNDDLLKLKKVYNRGNFISGYFKGEKIIYSKAQNHIGVQIGKVIDFKPGKRFNEVTIQSWHNLTKGDTLKIFDGEEELFTLSPVDIKKPNDDIYSFTTTKKLRVGQRVNLIVDSLMEEEHLAHKKILSFDAKGIFKEGEKAKLTLTCQGTNVTIEGDEVLQPALSSPLNKEEVRTSLSKCGEFFKLNNLDCQMDNVFLRKGKLSELRREALRLLKDKIIEKNQKNIKIKENKIELKLPKNNYLNNKKIIFFNNAKNIEKILNNYDYFVFSPKNYDIDEIIFLADKLREKSLFLDTPLIIKNSDLIIIKNILKKCKNIGIYATNYYALNLVEKDKTIVGSEMNITNSYSLDFYKTLGFNKIVLSKEDFDKSDLYIDDCEIFLDNRYPRYIYFNHCPIKEHFGGSCYSCKFKDGIVYKLGNEELILERKKVCQCHFYLRGKSPLHQQGKFGIIEEIL